MSKSMFLLYKITGNRLSLLVVVTLIIACSRRVEAYEFVLFGRPAHLFITDSIEIRYHNLSEPLVANSNQPRGSPLNPFSGIEHFIRQYGNNRLTFTRSGSGQAYADIFNRINIIFSYMRFQIGVRVDSSFFLNAPQPFDESQPELMGCKSCANNYLQRPVSPTGLEKIFLRYTDRHVDLTLGDFYVTFGRGLSLAIRKIDPLGTDTTILGAKIIVGSVFGPVALKFTGFSGVSNIQNVDAATGLFEQDPFDVLAGGRIEATILRHIILGFHVVGGLQHNPAATDALNIGTPLQTCLPGSASACYAVGRIMYGVSLEAIEILKDLSLYFESASLVRKYREGILPDGFEASTQGRPSLAFYGNLNYTPGPDTSIQIEGKWYQFFDPWQASTQGQPFRNITYNLPPTVERPLTELEDPQSNIRGIRLLITQRLTRAVFLSFSDALFFQEQFGGDAGIVSHSLTIHDPYFGLQIFWKDRSSHLWVDGGYRYEQDDQTQKSHKTTITLNWDLVQVLPRGWSLDTQGLVLLRSKASEPDWTEGSASLGFKRSPILSAAVGLEWSTRQSVRYEVGTEYPEYGLFPFASLRGNFFAFRRYQSSVALFAGGQRGGLRCLSGVCRLFPEFRGVRLDMTLRF